MRTIKIVAAVLAFAAIIFTLLPNTFSMEEMAKRCAGEGGYLSKWESRLCYRLGPLLAHKLQ